jgi:hypothetical protein
MVRETCLRHRASLVFVPEQRAGAANCLTGGVG